MTKLQTIKAWRDARPYLETLKQTILADGRPFRRPPPAAETASAIEERGRQIKASAYVGISEKHLTGQASYDRAGAKSAAFLAPTSHQGEHGHGASRSSHPLPVEATTPDALLSLSSAFGLCNIARHSDA
jgi:hypothetical protein